MSSEDDKSHDEVPAWLAGLKEMLDVDLPEAHKERREEVLALILRMKGRKVTEASLDSESIVIVLDDGQVFRLYGLRAVDEPD